MDRRTGAPGRGRGRMPGFRSYGTTRGGPDGWNTRRRFPLVAFQGPIRETPPGPLAGNKRVAECAAGAGDVEGQPLPVGTLDGGDGQAGTGLVSQHASR